MSFAIIVIILRGVSLDLGAPSSSAGALRLAAVLVGTPLVAHGTECVWG